LIQSSVRRDRRRLRDKAEFKLRRRSENFLELACILQTRHLDYNTVIALALDRRLRGAERIDAAPHTSIDCSTAARTLLSMPASST